PTSLSPPLRSGYRHRSGCFLANQHPDQFLIAIIEHFLLNDLITLPDKITERWCCMIKALRAVNNPHLIEIEVVRRDLWHFIKTARKEICRVFGHARKTLDFYQLRLIGFLSESEPELIRRQVFENDHRSGTLD